MDTDIKRHIMNIMKGGTGGCKHLEMTEALACSTCQSKMLRAQSEYNRLYREHPEKFVTKKADDGLDNHALELSQQFGDRVTNDKVYREHIRLLAHGTQEEKQRELKREYGGFYERNTGSGIRKLIL